MIDDDEVSLGGLDDAVGYLLRRAQMAVFDDFARRFAALDLTPAQFSTLLAIRANPGRRQSEIAAALGVQRPNFVALLDALERRGLATRVRSGEDRRANALELTATGETLLTRALDAQRQQEQAIRAVLGDAGRGHLIAALEKLARSLARCPSDAGAIKPDVG